MKNALSKPSVLLALFTWLLLGAHVAAQQPEQIHACVQQGSEQVRIEI